MKGIMLANLQHYRIVLGSNSPGEKELLAGLDLKFEVEVIRHRRIISLMT